MARKQRRANVAAKPAGKNNVRPALKKGEALTRSRRIPPLAWAVGGAIVVVVVLIALNATRSGEANREGIVAQARSLGRADAPVVLTEFSDFQCPFCARFAIDTEPQIIEPYVKTGKVRLEYKHFIVVGEESWWAAEAAECAAEQGRFWEYHDLLFRRQGGENIGTFAKVKLKGLATELKLDRDAFDKCLDSDIYKARVEADIAEGRALGVQSTPSFFVNKRAIVGAQPFSAFRNVIEQELAAQSGG